MYIAAIVARRRPFSVNKLLRATWLGGLGGTVAGAGVGWVQYTGVPPQRLSDARTKLAYDVGFILLALVGLHTDLSLGWQRDEIRMDDHATVGAILLAVLTPAVFYGRTRLVHSILGGASIGAGGGMLAHYWRSYQEGPRPTIKPHPVASTNPS